MLPFLHLLLGITEPGLQLNSHWPHSLMLFLQKTASLQGVVSEDSISSGCGLKTASLQGVVSEDSISVGCGLWRQHLCRVWSLKTASLQGVVSEDSISAECGLLSGPLDCWDRLAKEPVWTCSWRWHGTSCGQCGVLQRSLAALWIRSSSSLSVLGPWSNLWWGSSSCCCLVDLHGSSGLSVMGPWSNLWWGSSSCCCLVDLHGLLFQPAHPVSHLDPLKDFTVSTHLLFQSPVFGAVPACGVSDCCSVFPRETCQDASPLPPLPPWAPPP